MAIGVIGLRWHYFTDTVGGVALGTGTLEGEDHDVHGEGPFPAAVVGKK